jgi:hypothetical protein
MIKTLLYAAASVYVLALVAVCAGILWDYTRHKSVPRRLVQEVRRHNWVLLRMPAVAALLAFAFLALFVWLASSCYGAYTVYTASR